MMAPRKARVVISFLAGAATTACSLAIDRNTLQCSTNADCTRFESNDIALALCQDGQCVDSGLGPKGCFFGTPSSTAEYLNACSAAVSRPFDNCGRLNLCGNSVPADPLPPPIATTPSSVINPVAPPTVNCADGGPQVVYMTGASDFGPLLKAVTPLLTANSPPYRAVFQAASSCVGVSSVFDPSSRLIRDVPGSATQAANYAFYYDNGGNQVNCLLDPAGDPVDIGVSDLYSTLCNPAFQTSEAVAGYTGPVVAFAFTAPAGSSQDSISAEAAHLIFGRGGTNTGGRNADPWTNPTYYFVRNGGAASTALTAELIHVPRMQFWGSDRLSTDNLRDSMQVAAVADPSIGILSIDYADKSRDNLRVLHLQAPGQQSGYLPDSTSTSFDKANVRDGHYPLWGYVHFYVPIAAGGVPTLAAGAFVTRFAVPRLDQALIDAIIDASLVPQCAMKVARTAEIGDLVSNPNAFHCDCYFEGRTTGRTSCTPCATATDCPRATPACNYGFCERQ